MAGRGGVQGGNSAWPPGCTGCSMMPIPARVAPSGATILATPSL